MGMASNIHDGITLSVVMNRGGRPFNSDAEHADWFNRSGVQRNFVRISCPRRSAEHLQKAARVYRQPASDAFAHEIVDRCPGRLVPHKQTVLF